MTGYIKKEEVIKLIDTMGSYLDTIKTESTKLVTIRCAMHQIKRMQTLKRRVEKLDVVRPKVKKE